LMIIKINLESMIYMTNVLLNTQNNSKKKSFIFNGFLYKV
jgi:hypothetical protein